MEFANREKVEVEQIKYVYSRKISDFRKHEVKTKISFHKANYYLRQLLIFSIIFRETLGIRKKTRENVAVKQSSHARAVQTKNPSSK